MNLDEFPAVFQAIHGHKPFEWQTRLLHEVVAGTWGSDIWPEILAAPTSSGKTAVLDIALFHLAVSPRGKAPRRIVLCVDRRVIVDQAFKRAERIRDALMNSSEPAVRRFRDTLCSIAGGDIPLHVEELRGGLPREDDWSRDPAQPTILCTTVDQLGSRLLFRGYGVSPAMAPIHAGLLGEDALLFLDEAHLSAAFMDTLAGVRLHRQAATDGLGLPWAACMLTATPDQSTRTVFWLGDEERAEIAARLATPKTAKLVLASAEPGAERHAEALVEMAANLAGSGQVTAIIVNRVRLARLVFNLLPNEGCDKLLLTGRVRPAERDRLIGEHAHRLFAGRKDEGATRLFVVATQCIEAGADLDFDAMVTQIAPLDALRQRFGRLNRLGLLPDTRAVIVTTKAEANPKIADPIYDDRLAVTWAWLNGHAAGSELNMCDDHVRALVEADPVAASACLSRADHAPVLRGADVTFLSMTNPAPSPDPYLPLFLHGRVNDETDVGLVWRADLSEEDEAASDIIEARPPLPGEVLRVPIASARRWLAATSVERALDIADVEGVNPLPDDDAVGRRRVFRWRGASDDATGWIDAHKIRPNDVLILPAAHGGCDKYGWNPESAEAVEDIADLAALPYTGQVAVLRLHKARWTGDAERAWDDVWPDLIEALPSRRKEISRSVLERIGLPPAMSAVLDRVDERRKGTVLRPYGVDTEGRPIGFVIQFGSFGTTLDDLSASTGDAALGLSEHQADVERLTHRIADTLALPPQVRAAVSFAAKHHDDGKADDRFQAWLGGSVEAPLAKSGQRRPRSVEMMARARADVPRFWRHEVLSVRHAMMLLDDAAFDRDLALWLIGTHHGQGRPFFLHDDPWDAAERTLLDRTIPAGSGPNRLDFDWNGMDWPGLFRCLRNRYGSWGLALLEALVRLADHRASEKQS